MAASASRDAKKPLFVLGESLGAAVVIRAHTLGAIKPSGGVVLTGPLLRLAPEVLPPPPVVAVVRALAGLFPKLRMPQEPLDLDAVFGDAAVAKAARDDPLVVFDPPCMATAAAIITGTNANAAALELFKPPALLLLHGTKDCRCRPADSEEIMRRAPVADKTLTLLPGAKHQLLQDTAETTERVMRDIEAWILARAP